MPAPSTKAAADLIAALEKAEPGQRPALAAAGLGELGKGRLADELIEALGGFAQPDPAIRAVKLANGVDSPAGRAGWAQVCPADFDKFFKDLAIAAPDARLPLLRAACDPAKLRLIDGGAATVEPMALMLAIVTYGALAREGSVSEAELTCLKLVATAEQPPLDPEPAEAMPPTG